MEDPVGRVEGLLEEVEALGDPAASEKATELVAALLDMYGDGLGRILSRLDRDQAAALADDELLTHLFLVHDLHPVPVEERVKGALESVRPYLESHGGGVELLGVDEGVARLRLNGSCDGCPSSTMTLKLAIEDAIAKAAPDVERVEAEGVSEPAEPAGPALLQLEVSDAVRGDGWATAGGLPELSGGGTVVKEVRGTPVLFARVEPDLYAYRPTCPACQGSLEGAALRGAELACPECERRFDARRAGRCLDEPRHYLEPLPLLTDQNDLVKVALPTAVA